MKVISYFVGDDFCFFAVRELKTAVRKIVQATKEKEMLFCGLDFMPNKKTNFMKLF